MGYSRTIRSKSELEGFLPQLLLQALEIKADRIRFELDNREMWARTYVNRLCQAETKVDSILFQPIWEWIVTKGKEKQKGTYRTFDNYDQFICELTVPEGSIAFVATKSCTIRGKRSLLISKMSKRSSNQPAPDEMEPFSNVVKELPQLVSHDKDTEDSGYGHILVVEDDPDHRMLLERMLSSDDYRVSAVEDGSEAIKFLINQTPDLIVTDLMMPSIGGHQLVKILKHHPELHTLPIVVFTSVTDPNIEFDLLDLGVDDYCTKTLQRRILLKRIGNLLGRG